MRRGQTEVDKVSGSKDISGESNRKYGYRQERETSYQFKSFRAKL